MMFRICDFRLKNLLRGNAQIYAKGFAAAGIVVKVAKLETVPAWLVLCRGKPFVLLLPLPFL